MRNWERGTADDADLRRFYFGEWTLATVLRNPTQVKKLAKKRGGGGVKGEGERRRGRQCSVVSFQSSVAKAKE